MVISITKNSIIKEAEWIEKVAADLGFRIGVNKLKIALSRAYGYSSFKSVGKGANSGKQDLLSLSKKEHGRLVERKICFIYSGFSLAKLTKEKVVKLRLLFSKMRRYEKTFLFRAAKPNPSESIAHPVSVLRQNSYYSSALYFIAPLSVEIQDSLYCRDVPSLWLTRSVSENNLSQILHDSSGLNVKKLDLAKLTIFKGDMDFRTFISNFDILLASLPDVTERELRCSYLIEILSSVFSREINVIDNIEKLKSVFSLDNILLKIQSEDNSVSLWKERESFFRYFSVPEDTIILPNYVVKAFDYLINVFYRLAETYFSLFSVDGVKLKDVIDFSSNNIIVYENDREAIYYSVLLKNYFDEMYVDKELFERSNKKSIFVVNIECSQLFLDMAFSNKIKLLNKLGFVFNFFHDELCKVSSTRRKGNIHDLVSDFGLITSVNSGEIAISSRYYSDVYGVDRVLLKTYSA